MPCGSLQGGGRLVLPQAAPQQRPAVHQVQRERKEHQPCAEYDQALWTEPSKACRVQRCTAEVCQSMCGRHLSATMQEERSSVRAKVSNA